MNPHLWLLFLPVSTACSGTPAFGAPPHSESAYARPLATPPPSYTVYFGNLHAHSNLSDGNTGTTPAAAYALAKGQGKLDFLSLSEHNHMLTASEMTSLVQAATAATTGGFVALIGQEYSTIDRGFNHTNIENYPRAIPASLNGKYRQVFETLLPAYLAEDSANIVVAGFNHPKNIATDYGLQSDYGGDIAAWVRAMDPIVELIAIANGPADADNKDFVPAPNADFLHTQVSTTRWFEYLAGR